MITQVEVDPETGEKTTKKRIRAQKVGTGILDQLDRPKSVLFLDELNRARPDVQAALLQLICEHIVQDFEEDGGMRKFPNFLFTIAAINPSNSVYKKNVYELDPATRGRFGSHDMPIEKDVLRRYYLSALDREEKTFEKLGNERGMNRAKGNKAIIDVLLSSEDFKFDDAESEEETARARDDSWNGLYTSPRNLSLLLGDSDGTKDDFIKKWNSHCNSLH